MDDHSATSAGPTAAGAARVDDETVSDATAPLVVGIGARSGAGAAQIRSHLASVLAEHGLEPNRVQVVATIDARREGGVADLSAELGAELRTFPATLLDAQPVPTRSSSGSAVVRALGTASVAEAAVVATGARLIVPKHSAAGSTIAVGLTTPPCARPSAAPSTSDEKESS